MRVNKDSMRLYVITDRTWLGDDNLEQQVEEILKSGATFLQLREKNVTHEERVEIGKKIKKITDKYNIPFVINDDIMAAKEIDADGVHIGQSDMDYEEARRIMGADKIIGISAANVELAMKAERQGADYIGVGAVFTTNTKSNAKHVDYNTLQEIASRVTIPVAAIGGINENTAISLKGTGIDGICVISAIFAKEDKAEATKTMRKIADEIVED